MLLCAVFVVVVVLLAGLRGRVVTVGTVVVLVGLLRVGARCASVGVGCGGGRLRGLLVVVGAWVGGLGLGSLAIVLLRRDRAAIGDSASSM
jgi:hypothetical protein